MNPVVLSKRLKAVTDMVTRGSRACDVGCDHGFVSIYLIEQGISPKVLAMDVKTGPLSAAAGNIKKHNLDAFIETRLSDGLHNYDIGEADSLICAGMGGRLMMRILSEQKDKADSFKELVLQPQSEIESFRRFLRKQGYRITAEDMIEEDGKFYPVMRAVVQERLNLCKPYTDAYHQISSWNTGVDGEILCKLFDRYGPLLLLGKSGVLLDYLYREEEKYREILSKLQAEGISEGGRLRYTEVEGLLLECRAAIHIIKA